MMIQKCLNTVCKLLIVCILIVSMIGCNGTSNKMKLRKRKQITEVLIEAINNNNIEGIYNLFSKDIKKSDAKLLLQIKDICNYFDSKIESYDYRGGGQSDQYNEEERFRQRIIADYSLRTRTGKEYRLLYRAHTIGMDTNSTGLYSLIIISEEDYNSALAEYYVPMDGGAVIEQQKEEELKVRLLDYEQA